MYRHLFFFLIESCKAIGKLSRGQRSKQVPRTSSISITWELRNAESETPPQTYRTRNSGGAAWRSVFSLALQEIPWHAQVSESLLQGTSSQSWLRIINAWRALKTTNSWSHSRSINQKSLKVGHGLQSLLKSSPIDLVHSQNQKPLLLVSRPALCSFKVNLTAADILVTPKQLNYCRLSTTF